MEDVHNVINFGPTNPIQILNQHEIFRRFCMCNSNDTFDKNNKILKKVLGLNSKDRKSIRDKTNISYPKVNRGCAPLTANRTSADCVQISLGPPIPYMPLGVYHTGRFNAMDAVNSLKYIEIQTQKTYRHFTGSFILRLRLQSNKSSRTMTFIIIGTVHHPNIRTIKL